jgi:hypothetical protein
MEKFNFSGPIKNEAFAAQNTEAIERWDKEYEEMKQLKDEILEEAEHLKEKGIIKPKYNSFFFVQNLVVPELEKIAGPEKYKDYAASHVFIGSTVNFNNTPEVDLPDRQIYNFSNELLKKFHKANEEGRLEL